MPYEPLDILLKEHDQLRTQIDEHNTHLYTLLSVAIALLSLAIAAVPFLFSQLRTGLIFWLTILCAVLAGVLLAGSAHYFVRQSCRNIERCAYRLIVIEHRVNEHFGGDWVLEWETRWGCHAIGRGGDFALPVPKDVSTIRAWLINHPERRELLKEWLHKKGIELDPEIIVYGWKFAEARGQAISEFKMLENRGNEREEE